MQVWRGVQVVVLAVSQVAYRMCLRKVYKLVVLLEVLEPVVHTS